MTEIHGSELKEALLAATRCMEQYRDIINALNVFPVPDGDTGTNMLLTMRSGAEQLENGPDPSVSDVAGQWAKGVFWGARGNSGVILSQFFKGFAAALDSVAQCDGAALSRAFLQSAEAAYLAVSEPKEGTMLTVIRRAGEEVQRELDEGICAPLTLWETAFREAKTALSLTPTQLPALQEAGVVDSGGLGIVAILGGALDYMNTGNAGPVDLELDAISGIDVALTGVEATVSGEFLHSSEGAEWGYCTQFLLQGDGLVLERIREEITGFADSVVVVGDEETVRVHAHLEDPGSALSYGVAIGQLSQISIENMNIQNRGWVAGHRSRAEPETGVSVVAVAPGEGLAALFRDAGCAAVVSGGQTMNPSIQQLTDAAAETGVTDVIILPNNRNIILTAQQAAQGDLGQQSVHVIPATTVPQGVAAVLAFNPVISLEQNVAAMTEAVESVLTVEVTRAVRNATVDGVAVAEGDFMALSDGRLAAVKPTPQEALHSALEQAELVSDNIVTVYWGEGVTEECAAEVGARLEQLAPDLQVDVIEGGQPHYPYLASVE